MPAYFRQPETNLHTSKRANPPMTANRKNIHAYFLKIYWLCGYETLKAFIHAVFHITSNIKKLVMLLVMWLYVIISNT